MANVFKKTIPMMLKRLGDEYSTTVNSECITFYGILDDEEAVETDVTGKPVVIRQLALTVDTAVARLFTFRQVIKDADDKAWYVQETLKEADGGTTRCILMEK